MTGKAGLVSVVMIFYYTERFIREAIESVCAQSFSKWELLLVDDGSLDASTRIARDYARDQPARIRYLEHDAHRNQGMSASRNLGVRHARGAFAAFLDSDDVWLPNKLEEQLAVFNAEPEAGMVCGATEYWHSWENGVTAGQLDVTLKVGGPQRTLILPPTLITCLYPLASGTPPCPSDIMLRREVFEKVGGFEEQFRGIYQLYEDQAFLAKIYLQVPVYLSSTCWDRYRQHPESCVSKVAESGQYDAVRFFFLRWLETFFAEKQVEDTNILNRLQEALWPYRHPFRAALSKRGRGAIKLLRTMLRR